MPPQEKSQMPFQATAQQLPQPPEPKSHGFLWGFVIVLVIIFIAGVAAYWYRDQFLAVVQRLPMSEESNGVSGAGTMAVADYLVHRETTPDQMPNTVRIQLYGPAKLSGYDENNNLVTLDAPGPCRKEMCEGKNLRLDMVRQGASEEDASLLSMSLTDVEQSYEVWMQGGKKGIFYSPIITITLPTPPKIGVTATGDFVAWVPLIYYDSNNNKKYDREDLSTSSLYADEYVYVSVYVSGTGKPSYRLGWNAQSLHGEKGSLLQFENMILRLPWFGPVPLMSRKLSEQEMKALNEYKAQQQDPLVQQDGRSRGLFNNYHIMLEMYYDDHNAYPPTLASLKPKYIPADYPVDNLMYAALGSGSVCKGFHLGVLLPSPPTGAVHAEPSPVCNGSAPDFSGTDPRMLDIKR